MATKYVSLEKLTLYDNKIKAKIAADDATTLASAKKYTDDSVALLDPAGSAATAEQNAKTYTDGQISTVNTEIASVKTAAESAATAAAAAQTAADTAQTAADTAQDAVDSLGEYVGTIPETSQATSVVAYIDEKTAGIASDAALNELTSKVTQAEADIDAIEADYLKAADKTELQSGIDAIDSVVDTLVGADTNKSVRAIASEELAAKLIPADAQESLNTLEELAAWIQSHPEDAAAMNEAISALETLVGTLPEGITATDVVGYIAELVNAEETRATTAEDNLSGRIDTLEAAIGESGSIAEDIAAAQAAAEATAAADATSKADAALASAKSYTDSEVTKDRTRLDALEATTHSHTNKAELDLIASGDKTKWDAAAAKAHEHTNLTVLEGITAAKITAWDGSEQNAKTYADGLNTTMAGRMDTVEADLANFVECSEEDVNNLFN